jgi:hypothetical protein
MNKDPEILAEHLKFVSLVLGNNITEIAVNWLEPIFAHAYTVQGDDKKDRLWLVTGELVEPNKEAGTFTFSRFPEGTEPDWAFTHVMPDMQFILDFNTNGAVDSAI